MASSRLGLDTSGGHPLDEGTRAIFEPWLGIGLAHVRVHADARASDLAQSVGAEAFTLGQDVFFRQGRYAPEATDGRRLLAHELAHVAQQSGEAPAGGLVSRHPVPSIQRYASYSASDQSGGKSLGWVHPGGTKLNVSDDGQMAVEDNGWGANLSKRAWTTATKRADANKILAKQGSVVQLGAKGGSISGKVPAAAKGAAVTLEEVEPIKSAGSGAVELAADCGSAAKEVSGSGPAGTDVAVLKGAKTETYTTPRSYHGGDPTTPEEWSEEIFKKEFGAGLSRADAYKKYAALNPAQKEAFAKKYGINSDAIPKLGQALTVSTEKDMPGFGTLSGHTWNFHYAAVVLTSGNDYVTLENAAGWKRTDWIFFMYGPKSKAQTFHEFHGGTLTHGSAYTTMVVEPETALHVKTNVKDAPLLIGGAINKLALATGLRIVEKTVDGAGIEWLTVEVETGALSGNTGKIRSSFVG